MKTIDWSAEVIDSRDIITYLGELRDLVEAGSLDEDDRDEFEELEVFVSECEGYAPDWSYGETLIADRYFKEYARELAEETGSVDSGAAWPMNCIDWDQAADELKQDYTSVEFQGRTFWIR